MLPASWCDLKGTWTRGLSRQPIKHTAFNFKAHGPGNDFAFPLTGNFIPLEMMKYFGGNGEGAVKGAAWMGEGSLLCPSHKTRKGCYKYPSRYLGCKSAGWASLEEHKPLVFPRWGWGLGIPQGVQELGRPLPVRGDCRAPRHETGVVWWWALGWCCS